MFALDTHRPEVTSADGLKIWAAQAGPSAADAPTIVFIISDFVGLVVWEPNRASMSYTFRSALVGTMALSSTTVRLASQTEARQDPARFLQEAPRYKALCIVGDEDEVVLPDALVTMYKGILPHIDVVRIPEAGHMVFWERPVETKKAIVDFIEAGDKGK
ncbi:hypothetical protein SCUCBS95973_006028 [Sporothrix curviconia]|uniref:AB hydrolase-1 domain-containing protein n=1 Tax=Sporothrix curviconia TaxID=1260050 RepID=A0ABP0C3V1_9PEZI